jgi:hypothetical protein
MAKVRIGGFFRVSRLYRFLAEFGVVCVLPAQGKTIMIKLVSTVGTG